MGDLISELPIKDRYEVVDIKKLHENTWNPNVQQDQNFEALKRDIERNNGNYQQPVLVRPHPEISGDYEIVDGAHRYRAMSALGFEEIVIVCENLDDKAARLKTISMNKLRGDFDTAMLATLIVDLQKTYGVSEKEIQDMLGYTEEEIKGFESLIAFEPDSFDTPSVDDEDDENPILDTDDLVLTVTPKQRAAIEKLPAALGVDSVAEAVAIAALRVADERASGAFSDATVQGFQEDLATPDNPEEEALTESPDIAF